MKKIALVVLLVAAALCLPASAAPPPCWHLPCGCYGCNGVELTGIVLTDNEIDGSLLLGAKSDGSSTEGCLVARSRVAVEPVTDWSAVSLSEITVRLPVPQ